MNKNRLQQILIAFGIAINIAFLVINVRPDRPHLAKLRHLKVLLRSDAARAKWIADNELAEFGVEHDVEIEVLTLRSFEEVLTALKAERDKPTGLLVAAIDSGISEELKKEDAVIPIGDGIAPGLIDETLAQYLPEALAPCRGSDKKIWYLPKSAEIDIAAYLIPAVEDVYLHWEQDRADIANALAEANGVGLPRGYQFQKSPDDWNSYDLFVAGWYWAHHPAPWADGNTGIAPRLALRTGDNEDAFNDLIVGFYRHGMDDNHLGDLESPAIIDALQWEALLRKHHLLAPQCEDPNGLDSDAANELIKARKIAWTPINQEDSLWVHGGSQRTAMAGLPRPEELSWAVLPGGASVEQKDNKPARSGVSFSFTKLRLWAVPKHSPDRRLAFELASFVTQRRLEQRETEAQGMLPIRKDLRAEYPILFRLSWMQRILDASYRQVASGSHDTPARIATEGLDDKYDKLRDIVVYGRPLTAPVTFSAIGAAVHEVNHGK